MTNRTYRFLLGLSLLVTLYFNLQLVMWLIIGIVLFEGITNLRIPKLVNQLRKKNPIAPPEGCLGINFRERIGFEAERGWRILVPSMLILSYVLFYETLWFIPWFMGFAIFGAGISGVCPMFLMLKWLGFR